MTKKNLSDADSQLFRQTIGQVKKIKHNSVTLKPKPLKPIPKEKLLESNFNTNPIEKVKLQLTAEAKVSFLAAGLQRNLLKQLQCGYFELDVSLDLHGLNSYQAQKSTARFLHECIENGYRCVHIVHGKGYRSEANYPVLKNDLNIWLRNHIDVQAFCSATPKEGGTGAMLVLLSVSEKYWSI